MKNKIIISIIAALLLAGSALAAPEEKKEIVNRRHLDTEGPRIDVKGERKGGPNWRAENAGPREMEKVAYLGIETMPVDPTVAAQLGLSRNTGLVIRRVAAESPAADLLKQHDVLKKIDDQILINMQQLTVLVRNHQAGDEIKLTILRGGKESTVKAKLAEREVPKMAMGENQPMMQFFGQPGASGGMMFNHEMPGFPGQGPREVGDAMRMIGGDQMHWLAKPRVHIIRRQGGKGATILDLPSGNFVFSDDDGSVEVNASEGKRDLTVKDKQGNVTFQGPINTPEDHEKLPPGVMSRLEAIGRADMGADHEGLQIETRIMEPASKISGQLPPPKPVSGGMRTL